jgi:hypothetical protein
MSNPRASKELRVRRAVYAALAFAVALAFPLRAKATTKDACVKSFEEGQVLRRRSKLVDARAAFGVCAQAECPGVVSAKCSEWLTEVERTMPTVVLGARLDGADTVDVQVSIDGAVVTSRLDGTARAVDPGEHRVRFKHPSAPAVELTVVLREGDKNRLVSADLRRPSPAALAPPPTKEPERSQAEHPASGVPLPTWIFGAVGVVALGSFAYFGLNALDQSSTLRETCAPSCDPSDVSAIKTKNVISGLSLGVGLLSLGAAVYWLLTSSPPGDAHAPARALR